MLSDGVQKLNTNTELVNGDFCGDLKSCITEQVESFMLPIITSMKQVLMSLTTPEDLATQQQKKA